jgi:hypothetical protein
MTEENMSEPVVVPTRMKVSEIHIYPARWGCLGRIMRIIMLRSSRAYLNCKLICILADEGVNILSSPYKTEGRLSTNLRTYFDTGSAY